MNTLRDLGFDIIGEQKEKTYCYSMVGKEFELAELKLLVDAIQSSKFITEKKSRELIKKLENFASTYESKQLQRQVVVSGRIKTMNESIYYNVDEIHRAISNDREISFQYYTWNMKKELEFRRNGDKYIASPWALSWDNENYYLVAYDSSEKRIKHFRVDKMRSINMLEDRRKGKDLFKTFNMASYAKSNFSMFGGELTKVRIQFSNSLIGVVLDRFGKDIIIASVDDNHFTVTVEVAISDQFLGWIFALGAGAKLMGPAFVVDRMREEVKVVREIYEKQ